MMYDGECFLVVGHAQTARNTNLNDVYDTVSVQLQVKRDTKVVVKANLNVISPLTNRFFQEIVVGYCMDDPIEPILDTIRENMLTPSTGSTVQAMRNAWIRYRDSKFCTRK